MAYGLPKTSQKIGQFLKYSALLPSLPQQWETWATQAISRCHLELCITFSFHQNTDYEPGKTRTSYPIACTKPFHATKCGFAAFKRPPWGRFNSGLTKCRLNERRMKTLSQPPTLHGAVLPSPTVLAEAPGSPHTEISLRTVYPASNFGNHQDMRT